MFFYVNSSNSTIIVIKYAIVAGMVFPECQVTRDQGTIRIQTVQHYHNTVFNYVILNIILLLLDTL